MKNVCLLVILFLVNVENVNAQSCESAVKSMKRVCVSSKIVSQIISLLKVIESNKRSNNIYQACSLASQLSQISFKANTTFAMSCGRSAILCKRACTGDNRNSLCEHYQDQSELSKIQGIYEAINLTQSKECVAVAAGKCFQNGKVCRNNYANTSMQYNPSIQTASLIPQEVIPSYEVSKKTNYVFDKDEKPSGGAKVDEIPSAQSKFLNSEFSSSRIDAEKVPVEKDLGPKEILEGERKEQVSGSSTVNWVSKGGTLEVVSDGINFRLEDFLPKGIKDPSRAVASEYQDAMITPANGLSNFQKVTRKMNEKRPELLP
jgi:hypothetical protein